MSPELRLHHPYIEGSDMTATIEAEGLTKRYGKTKALDGLDSLFSNLPAR